MRRPPLHPDWEFQPPDVHLYSFVYLWYDAPPPSEYLCVQATAAPPTTAPTIIVTPVSPLSSSQTPAATGKLAVPVSKVDGKNEPSVEREPMSCHMCERVVGRDESLYPQLVFSVLVPNC
jgi:hypothetical protein